MNILEISKRKERKWTKLYISISKNKNEGKLLDKKYAIDIASQIKINQDIDGIVILSNEPLSIENTPGVSYLLDMIESILQDHISTWIYTSYTFDELLQRTNKSPTLNNLNHTLNILAMTDVLVLCNKRLNEQRFIDINKTLKKLDKLSTKRLLNGKLPLVEYRGDYYERKRRENN